ncbi:MAG: S-layer homology domain-containing protein [Clostridia bacterium]|nr:S-layer homology domain-containing protein [Clostridia bacterium]
MKKILSVFFAMIMTLSCITAISASSSGFSDVAEGRWSASAIKYAVDRGYMNGVGDGKFDPTGALTRGMVATVLWRREGSPAPTAPSGFSDVPAGSWYADAVAWAKQTGVVNGMTETTFAPNAFITREQLATMLFRFSATAPVSVPERADLSPFADDEKTSAWAKESLEWAVEAGLINGTDGNRLAPSGNATREQFAAIIERYDGSFKLAYNEPVLFSHYTEPEYPLVTDADFYVSTAGDDSADGSFSHPFRTWERARDAVRALDKTGRHGIKVAFMAGDYGPLSLELTAEDSGTPECPVTYCKYGDGDVVFNNGFDVPSDELLPLDEADKALFCTKNTDKIKKADVSDKLADYDPTTCMIMDDGGILSLARFPNLFEDGSDNLIQSGVAYDIHHIQVYNALFKKYVKQYHTIDGLYLYGYIATGWYKDMILTDGFEEDPESGNIVFYVPHPEDVYFGSGPQLGDGFASDYFQMAIVNVSEELDAPGEFWVDGETGTFYVYDPRGDCRFVGGKPSKISESENLFIASEEGGMVTLGEGARYITLLGLSFRNSGKYMIRGVEHPRGLTIDRCSFAGCAALNMIEIRANKEGEPLDLLVTRCDFSTSVARAVTVFVPDFDRLYNRGFLFTTGKNVLIDNNYFTRTNLRIGNLASVCVNLPSPRVSHNLFEDCCWQCVDIGRSTNSVVEYNVFDRACTNGDDTGAIGESVYFGSCGGVIRYNLFMNINGGQNGRFGVYLDNAIGTTAVSNLFYNVGTTVVNNDISICNEYRDNVSVIGPTECDYDVDHTEAAARDLGSGEPGAVPSSWTYARWVSIFEFFDANPELKKEAEEKWPGFFDITTDTSRWQEREFCENSSLVITGNRSFNKTAKQPEFKELLVKYSTIEDNIAFTFEDNPYFVNPTRGDYRIRDGAEFPDIQFEKIGRY